MATLRFLLVVSLVSKTHCEVPLQADRACSNSTCTADGSQVVPAMFGQPSVVRDFFTWENIVEESRRDRYLYLALVAIACYPFFWMFKKLLCRLVDGGTAHYIAKMKDDHDVDVSDTSSGTFKRALKETETRSKERAAAVKNAQRSVALVLLKHPYSSERAQTIVREAMMSAGLEVLDDKEGDILSEKVCEWSDEVKDELVELGTFNDGDELAACAAEGAKIHYWIVTWGGDKYQGSWIHAVSEIFGSAADGGKTVRGMLAASWPGLFKCQPIPLDCGLAVSHGALAGLRQRQLCLGTEPESDPFGSALVQVACVDSYALKEYWVETGAASRAIAAQGFEDNAVSVMAALKSSGSPVVWRRPGGIKCNAIGFGKVGSNAVVICAGAVSLNEKTQESVQLRAAAFDLADRGQLRVLIISGGVEEICDATAWLKRRECFSESALPPDRVQALDGGRKAPETASAKVEAQFGSSGPWLHGVIQSVKHDAVTGQTTYAVRFFTDEADESRFDQGLPDNGKDGEGNKVKEASDKDGTKKTDGTCSKSDDEEQCEGNDVPRVALFSLSGTTTTLVLQAAARLGGEVAASAVLGLSLGSIPPEAVLKQLAAPLQAHLAGSRVACFIMSCQLKLRLMRARMEVNTFYAPPATLISRLQHWCCSKGDAGMEMLKEPVKKTQSLRREVHAYHMSSLPLSSDNDMKDSVRALLLRRCVRFLAEAVSDKGDKFTDDERKEKAYTRFSVVLPRFGIMLGPAAWRDIGFLHNKTPPNLTLLGPDLKTPGLLDCPASLMLAASTLAIVHGIVGSLKMRKSVFFMQAVSTNGVSHSDNWALGMEMLLYSLAEWLIDMPKDAVTSAGSRRVSVALKELCFHALLQQDVAYVDTKTVDGMQRLLHRSTGTISRFLADKFPEVLSAVSCFSSAISMLMFFCPHLLIHFLALAIFKVEIFMALFHFHHMMHKRLHGNQDDWPKDRSGETLSNFKAVRAYNRQAEAEQDFSKMLTFTRPGGHGSPFNVFHLSWMVINFSFQYFEICSQIYTGSLVVGGVISMSIAQQMLEKGNELVHRTWWIMEELGMVCPPWRHKDETWLEAGAKLLVLFERKPPICLDKGEWDASNIGEFRGEIELRGVTFRYPPKTAKEKPEAIFEDFDLHIPGGSKVGLVGPSGGGKTTALALIQRFYDPEAGEVLLDGRPLKSYKPSFISSVVSVVQQESAIFDMTVAENIRWGKPDATQEEIEDALMKASLYHDLDRKPLRFETPAVELSGGQKQRLTIARAIVRRPKILLLDEATAALDTKSEREVQKALNCLMTEVKGTCVAIAHRLSTIMDSDSIAVIKNKKVVEQGSHAELVAKDGGEYAELSRLAGMAGGEAPEKGDEDALRELMQLINAEAERDPGSTLMPLIQQKLTAAKAWTDAERRHLQELSQTYERALQKHMEDKDAAAMQMVVEESSARCVWSASKGKALAKFTLLPPPSLQRQLSAPGPSIEHHLADDPSPPLLVLEPQRCHTTEGLFFVS